MYFIFIGYYYISFIINQMDFFNSAVDKLLTHIALDYNLSKEELVNKYIPEIPRKPCSGLTGKQTPCKNKCLPGFDLCHLHNMIEPRQPKPPRVPKTPKMQKEQPAHNHAPGVLSKNCQLCLTHGNAMNPFLTKIKFGLVCGNKLRDLL